MKAHIVGFHHKYLQNAHYKNDSSLACAKHHLAIIEPPRDVPVTFCRRWNVNEAHAGVNGEVIHALLCLPNQCIAEEFPTLLNLHFTIPFLALGKITYQLALVSYE
jgi:hypothetical protein